MFSKRGETLFLFSLVATLWSSFASLFICDEQMLRIGNLVMYKDQIISKANFLVLEQTRLKRI